MNDKFDRGYMEFNVMETHSEAIPTPEDINEDPPEESHEESRSAGTNEASPEDTDEESVTQATDFAEIPK